jgi:hypothetical protein
MFEVLKQFEITCRYLNNYIVHNHILIYVLNKTNQDTLNFLNLDSGQNFELNDFIKIEYFGLFDNLILVNDTGKGKMLLIDFVDVKIVDEIEGLYYCSKEVRNKEHFLCVSKNNGRREVVNVQIVNSSIKCDLIKIVDQPDHVFDDHCFKMFYKDIICNSLASGREIWRFNTDSVRQDGMVAPDGMWFIDDKLVLRTEADFNKGFAGPNYLVWLDINTGEILFKRNDAKPMIRRVEDDLYYLDMPFSDAGYFKIISLRDGSTKVDIPTRDIFASYATVNRVSDNYTYSKQGSDLCILHLDGRAITILDLANFVIKDHFKVDTQGRYLRGLQFYEKWIFVIDDLKVLHIFQKK